MTTFPSANPSAWSTLSATRVRKVPSAFRTNRSITISMSCLIFLSRPRFSSMRTTLPSTLARTNPRFTMSAKKSTNAPFCPRTTGASTRNFVPSGRARTRPTICSRVCAVIGRWQFGQYPCPHRAYSTRR